MPGANFRASIGGYAGPGSMPTAATASEAAFGPGGASNAQANLAPSHPMGVALWGGVAALGALVFVYRSLPADRRWGMEVAVIVYVLGGPVKGLIKMPLQRLAQEPITTGPVDVAARAGLWVLS